MNKSLLLPQPNHENKTKKTLDYKWEQPHKNLDLKISIEDVGLEVKEMRKMGQWWKRDGSVEVGQGRKRDGSGEEERSAQTTFISGGACRHDGGAVGWWLVLGFIDDASLLPLAWAWRE